LEGTECRGSCYWKEENKSAEVPRAHPSPHGNGGLKLQGRVENLEVRLRAARAAPS
jgi:hypothetical protein